VTPFAATIFVGAFLLFLLQPLIGKFLLPWFGGAPGVWTTCILFFQTLLLAGYVYAHFSSRWLKLRAQALVHLALVAIAIASLQIIPSPAGKPTGLEDPVPKLLGLLFRCIGLPFFALAATGPLLQHWFCRTHPQVSPYRLYSLSNLGSLLALILFPLVIEVQFSRQTQAMLWGCGLIGYAIGCVLCARKLWRHPAEETFPLTTPARKPKPSPPPDLWQKILWLLLPAGASVLLLATTNKICQDVAVVPLLWVLPLGLYLLSFIICFDNPRWYKRAPFLGAVVATWLGVCWLLTRGTDAPILFPIGILCACLFFSCMVAHGELYRLKPDPRHLTGYYLVIATGGALGGIFVAVIAPLLFNGYYEWEIGLLGSGVLFLAILARDLAQQQLRTANAFISASVLIGLLLLGRGLGTETRDDNALKIYQSRNFYGTLTLWKSGDEASGRGYLHLSHGRTVHGIQLFPPNAGLPTLYYGENSGAGLALAALPPGKRRVGLIGLGIGTLAAYANPGDTFRFYEINPEVVRLAQSRFGFLPNAAGNIEGVIGDARLLLEGEPDQHFDLIALDAFSSDSIPIHLLTREAFTTYARHLKTNGVIAVHISNHYLDLEQVLLNVAKHFNYEPCVIESGNIPDKWWLQPSTWVLLSPNQAITTNLSLQLARRPQKKNLAPIPLWTDDFANLFQILKQEKVQAANDFTVAQNRTASELCLRRDYNGAVEVYRQALRQQPNSPELLNGLAWLQATCPNFAIRNGPNAVALAERACELTHYQVAGLIETLAAAYAESGRFPEAIQWAQKATFLASATGQTGLNPQLIDRYRAGKAVGR
jgi:tetratricopeptide (TPR) repeat protein